MIGKGCGQKMGAVDTTVANPFFLFGGPTTTCYVFASQVNDRIQLGQCISIKIAITGLPSNFMGILRGAPDQTVNGGVAILKGTCKG